MSQKSFRGNKQRTQVQWVPKKQAQAMVQNAAKSAVNQAKQQKQKQPKKPKQSKGRITAAGQFLRTAGATAGAFLGNAGLGRSLGAGISRIFGQGDYQVQSNSLTRGGPPAFAAMNTGMRVAHREYIGDVLSTTSFGVTTYDVNPSNATSFPWLSKLAVNFEEYSIKGIVYYFNTTCGSAISSTNNALGTVGLVTVYDPTDPALGSKRECEDYSGCVAGVPAQSLLHPIECKPRSNVLDRLYIQTASLADPDDKKFYSHGTLNVFTQGMQQANVNVGELWVSYDIEFYNPKILPVGTVTSAASKTYIVTSAQTTAQPFGTLPFSMTGNLGVTYDGITGAFTIPNGTAPGYYLFACACSSTTTACFLAANGSFSSNMSLVNVLQGNITGITATPNASSSNPWHGGIMILRKSDTAAGTFGPSWGVASPAGTLGADIFIVKLPNSLYDPSGFLSSVISPSHDSMFKQLVELLEKQGRIKPLPEIPEIIEKHDQSLDFCSAE